MDAVVISMPKKVSKWAGMKRKKKRVLLLFLPILIIFTGVFIYWKYFYIYGDGYRTGLLQKFSHKGNFTKTYEGEMILSGITGNTNIAFAFEKFNFSVTSKALAMQLDSMQGKLLTVHYSQKNGILFWHGDSRYLVDGVKFSP